MARNVLLLTALSHIQDPVRRNVALIKALRGNGVAPDKVITYVQTSDGLPVYTADDRPVAVLI